MNNGISLQKVSFSYAGNSGHLTDINLTIPRGSFLGITGINGSGKTTLTQLLNGLIPHEIPGKFSGDVYVDSINTRHKPVSFFASKIGMLFQNPDFMLFNITVAEEIAFGLKNLKIPDINQKITRSLKDVGLENYENRDPNTLSFGEKQKTALACILALDTPYIVLDEPVAMLDFKSALNLYRILDNLRETQGKTIIVVEHDTDFLLTYASEVAIMDNGKILLNGKTKDIFHRTSLLKQIGIKIPRPVL